MKVVLPWPNPKLMPNRTKGHHWSTTQAARKEDRAAGYTLTLNQLRAQSIDLPDGKIPLTIRFYPPDNRRRDDDNVIASAKNMRDGFAEALGVDDHRFRCTYVIEDSCKPGRVEIELP